MPRRIIERIDLNPVAEVLCSREFHLVFSLRSKGAPPARNAIYHYGKHHGLGEVESWILGSVYHALRVESHSCYLKNHQTDELWDLRFTPNKIFNGNGIKLYKIERLGCDHSLLQMQAKEPSIFSTFAYKELYKKLDSRVNK